MLTGIARLAANARTLESKRRVEYLELVSRSLLTRCGSDRVPFRWTINPYRGCEFGCKYCYARYAHEFLELRDPLQFERKIFAKCFDREQFRSELTRLPMGETIALGTATDPYQPAERRFLITRSILEVFAATAGYRLGITSKSDLIARDLDLLREISRRHYLSVHITITSMDRDLVRLIEPMAPRPDLRMNAVRKLAAAGIRVGVFCSPVMPLINDSEPCLDGIAKAARSAGANNFGANVLFLKPCSYAVFLPFLEAHFPLLARRYRERFERSAYLKGNYPSTIQERVAAIRRRYRFHPQAQREPELWPQDPQLALF
jgi:DNA repair photolyase